MKYSILLIATVFLIGISVSDAKGEKNGQNSGNGKNAAQDETTDKQATKEDKPGKADKQAEKENSGKGAAKDKEPVENEADDTESEDDDAQTEDQETEETGEQSEGETEEKEEQEPEEEEAQKAPPPRKTASPKSGSASSKKKPTPTNSAGKRRPAPRRRAEEEDPEEERPRPKKKAKKNKTPPLSDLKDQAASMNPANLIAALQSTPANQLKKVLPQLNKLTNMLDGTPLGPIFENLTSLLGNSSPQIWQQLFRAFPNFLSTIIGTTGQLAAVATTAFGRTVTSIVDIADVLFNGGKDLLGTVTMLPGGQLLTPLGQVLDTVHGTVVTPVDSFGEEAKAAGKRELKKLKRASDRTRSGLGAATGGLFQGLL